MTDRSMIWTGNFGFIGCCQHESTRLMIIKSYQAPNISPPFYSRSDEVRNF